MAQKLESGPMQVHHGHTDTQVLIKFSRPTDHVLMTPAQTEEFIAAVRESMAKLEAHRKTGEKLSG